MTPDVNLIYEKYTFPSPQHKMRTKGKTDFLSRISENTAGATAPACKFLFISLRFSAKELQNSLEEGTLHFFLSQKEKSSKKEVGERAARALSALARKAR